ncbi:helix-turn-helix domain-containing protein [Nocardia carnea]|uniref:helix-turn-helix domain-containing protein n=1 Tax=Nocardia carnea TaxID=37328 RepID=UPI002457D4AE|nr:helix-turn-helix transcriptional regulator [Nocardia carnea]
MAINVGEAVLRRHIGRRMAELREAAGLTQKQAAAALQKGVSTIGRMEEGNLGVRFRDVDVQAILNVYKVSAEEQKRLLAYTAATRNGRTKQWWESFSEDMPEWFSLYVILEDSAASIREYESELIPGLLQTRDYIEQLARTPAGLLDDVEVQQRVQIRLERQGLLTRSHAPRLDTILNEAVIRRPVGGPEVMLNQLDHLLKVSSHNNITVRILPYSAGVHGGMAASAFILLDFPTGSNGEHLEPPIAYVDTLTGSMYLNNEFRSYELAWNDLEQKVLGEDESRQLIISTMEGLQQ